MFLSKLTTGWVNTIEFIWYYFSISLLIRTFFRPWKREYWREKQRGFHPLEIFYIGVSNLLSRILGMIVRAGAILFGVCTLLSAILFSLPVSALLLFVLPDSVIFDKKRLFQTRSLAWDWHFGYTPLLDQYSYELYFGETSFPLIGKEKEYKTAARILAQSKGKNMLIVGEPGSGRHALLTYLAHHFITHRFLVLDLVSYLKDKKTKPEQTGALATLLDQAAYAGNIILIINHFQQIVDFIATIEPYLEHPELHIIGVSTVATYHDMLLPNKTLMKYFTVLDVNPPTREHIIQIVQSRSSTIAHAPLSIKALNRLVDASYTLDAMERKGQPEAVISLLGEFDSWHQLQDKDQAHNVEQEIITFLHERLELPSALISGEEKTKLKFLEHLLHARIVNQEIAISQIANALRRRRLNLSDAQKPIGSFLFLGPTGVGKTETAKALAAIFFEDETKLLRFDMASYQDSSQINTLVAELSKEIREHPYGVLLLDELEKAHSSLLNILLTVTDEGYLADTHGGKVLCNNLIIIATSNAASEFIREQIKNGEDTSSSKATSYISHAQQLNEIVIEHLLQKGSFSPEFINRFDAVTVFTPLSPVHLEQIVGIKLAKLRKRVEEQHGKTIHFNNDLIHQIVQEGSHHEFGAREIDRAIKRLVEDKIAQELLV